MSRKEDLRGRESRLLEEIEALKKELAMATEQNTSLKNTIRSLTGVDNKGYPELDTANSPCCC